MLRDIKLSIELREYAIFYHWNYSPPVQNIGGGFGRIYPNGALYGVTFDELKSLGSGAHAIQVDENNRTPAGTKPNFDEEQNQLELLELVVFGYDHGVFTETELLQHSLQSFSPTNSGAVMRIAPGFLLELMSEYAARVPKILDGRTPDCIDFFSPAGGTRIPDENLQLLFEKLVH